MLEIVINKEGQNKQIILLENGKVVECYNNEVKEEVKEGNIYCGKIKDIIPGMQAAFVDIGIDRNAFIHIKDILPKINEKEEKNVNINNIKIGELIKKDDSILVQIKKGSIETKGARISTHISLTGKYIVFMPNTNIITISQKINDINEINRLKEIIEVNMPKGNGAIIRTSALKKKEDVIRKEINELYNKWKKIEEEFNKSKGNVKLLYKNPDIVEKMLLDLYDKKIEKIMVNDEKEYNNIKKQIEEVEEYKNIKIEKKKSDLLKIYDIEKQIEKINNRKVWLNCGGFITIDKTEALTAIDVNTGKYTGKQNIESTVYKVNYEATVEIVKQLKLRDIGGIIIIDYIDMHNDENKNKITELLKELLKNDRAKTQVEGFTKLDLMEMTRKHIYSSGDN